MAANSAVSVRIWPNFEILRALIHVIIACKESNDKQLRKGGSLSDPTISRLNLIAMGLQVADIFMSDSVDGCK